MAIEIQWITVNIYYRNHHRKTEKNRECDIWHTSLFRIIKNVLSVVWLIKPVEKKYFCKVKDSNGHKQKGQKKAYWVDYRSLTSSKYIGKSTVLQIHHER